MTTATWRGPTLGSTLLRITVFAIAVFLIAPLLVVIPMSFSDSTLMQFPPQRFSLRWYAVYFSNRAWIDATWMSLKAGLLVAVISTALGTAAAVGLARSRCYRESGGRLTLPARPAI